LADVARLCRMAEMLPISDRAKVLQLF